MPGVSFFINGNANGALGAINSTQKAIHSLSNELNTGLRNTLIGAFSIEAIKEAVVSTIEFADNIKKTSDRMGVTTDNVQALRIAARDAGKDLGSVEKAFNSLEKSSRKALSGNTKTKNAFANLGISEDDLKHLDKMSLLQKTMQGAGKMGRSEAEGNLTNIFGSRGQAGVLMAMQPKLSNFSDFKAEEKSKGAIASDDDIEALAEVKDRWEEIIDGIKTSAIPVLSWLLDAIFDFGHGVKQLVELVGTYIGALVGSIQGVNIGGLIESFGDNLITGWKALFTNLWGIISGKLSVSDVIDNAITEGQKQIGNTMSKGFGVNMDTVNQVVQEELLRQGEEDSKIANDRAKKKQDRLNEQNKMNDDPNRQPDSHKEKKSLLDKDLKDKNEFLKVGGMMGVDTNYRLERLQTEANELLRDIRDAVKGDDNQLPSEDDQPEDFSGA